MRNLLIRGEYRPSVVPGEEAGWLGRARAGRLTADELLTAYCRHVYEQVGTYEAVAGRLGVDRRTVKARMAG